MRNPDYDASKPLPADFVATKPTVTAVAVQNTSARSTNNDGELELEDDENFRLPVDSDDEVHHFQSIMNHF